MFAFCPFRIPVHHLPPRVPIRHGLTMPARLGEDAHRPTFRAHAHAHAHCDTHRRLFRNGVETTPTCRGSLSCCFSCVVAGRWGWLLDSVISFCQVASSNARPPHPQPPRKSSPCPFVLHRNYKKNCERNSIPWILMNSGSCEGQCMYAYSEAFYISQR